MAKLFHAIIMGPPGSGKGTISSRIVRHFNLSYLASGDVLRAQIYKETDKGVIAKKYIEKGQLVPDDLMSSLILDYLKEVSSKSWLLDGFPRTLKQAEVLSAQYEISSAISLNVPDEIIISRLKGRWLHPASGRVYNTEFNPPKVPNKDDITGESLVQREDDMPHIVQARLNVYKLQNSPVLEYYRRQNILTEFVGKESNEIWPRVKGHLEQIIYDLGYDMQ